MSRLAFQRCAAACLILTACGWFETARASDSLLIHGHIYTGDPQQPWVTALGIQGTRIDAVGTDQQILKGRKAHSRIVDLHGQTVIPGIVDSHMHLLYGAFALHGINLSTPDASIELETTACADDPEGSASMAAR